MTDSADADPLLPSWWPSASSSSLAAVAPSAPEAIARGAAAADAPALASSLLAKGFAVVDGFLGAPAAAAVRSGIAGMDRAGRLRLGKLQHGTQQSTNDATRSDRIAFLQPDGCAGALAAYVAAVDALRCRLTAVDALVERVGGELDGCNFMAATYPGGGTRYVKHRDALPYQAGRKLTVIYYVNAGWRPAHGGELRLWPEPEGAAPPVVLAPVADRLVCFISSLEHEVLPAWAPRFALTTWMFNRRDTALESLAEDLRQKKAAGRLNTQALLAALDADDSEEEDEDEDEEMDAATAKKVMMMLMMRKKKREAEAQAS